MPRPSQRSHIAAAAFAEFRDRGYEATSLQAIGDAAGVTKAAVQYHFKTKREIIDEIIEPIVLGYDSLLEELERRRKAPTAEEIFRRYLGVMIDFVDQAQYLNTDIPFLQSQPDLLDRFAVQRSRFVDLLTRKKGGPTERLLAGCALGLLQDAARRLDIRNPELSELVVVAAVRVLDA